MWLPDDDDVAPDAVRRQERHTATALTRTLAFIRSRLALDRHSEALRAAKATETQLRGLQTLTDTALAHLDLDDLLPALLDQVREVMGVDHAIVLLLEEDGQHLRVRMARGPEAVLVADVQATVGVSFIGRIAATREPLIIEDVMSLPFPIQRSRRRARSAAGVPLLLQGRLVGVLSVTATEQQRFTRQDVELLQRVAERVTIAIERSQRYEDERRARAEAEAARAEAQIARAEADAARAQAQRQAEQLDRMIEAVADGVTVWDDAGRLVRTNAALRQMMALDSAPPAYFEQPPRERMALYAPRDAQGHLLAAEDWPATRALRGEVLTGADAVDLHMRTFEGRELVFTASAGPLRDQDGHIVGAVGILRDQTERNRLVREREAALVASEAWFHTLADTAPVLIWASGPDGLLTFVNQPSLQFAGRSLEDELVGGWADGLHPDDHDRCLQTYQAAFQTRERFTAEYRVRHANGEYRWVVGTGVPRFAPDGTFLGYIGSAMDVSEPKRLERALAEQAEQLDRIVEAMGEGLFVYDTQGQVVRTNAAARRLLGWDTAPPDIAHLPADERIALYAPREEQGSQLATPAEWLAERAQASGDGEILSETEARDIRMRALDGRELEVSASMAPLRTPDGQVAGGVLLLSDRTERNQLLREREEARASELALREVNERLDTFVTMAAHDLRSPVAVSRMVVQRAQHLLGQAAAGADPLGSTPTRDVIRAAQALATTEGNLDRLWRLVQQLLDVSRAREGTLVLNRQRVDLADVVRT